MRYREILLNKMSKMERDIQAIKKALNIPDESPDTKSPNPLQQDELPFKVHPINSKKKHL